MEGREPPTSGATPTDHARPFVIVELAREMAIEQSRNSSEPFIGMEE